MSTDFPEHTFFHDGQIDRHLALRVCARCYNDLAKRLASGRLWEAYCPICETTWGGTTIARTTAEQRGQLAIIEAREIKNNLPDLFPNQEETKTINQLLNELGF